MGRTVRLALVPVLIALVGGLGTGPERARAQGTGAIEGRVLSADDGVPLEGATVAVESLGTGAVTAENGSFRIEGVPPGERTLVTRHLGHASPRTRVTVRAGETASVEIALETEAIHQPGIVVTANRTRTRAEDVAASVSVLPADAVRTNAARTTDDLLKEMVSVDLPRSSSTVSHPTAQSVSIRGTGGNRSLVLLDGVPLNDAFGGWIRWNQAPPSLIERVEVVRGGGSSLFGTYAMGGVIQLFRRRPQESGLRLQATGGERGVRHFSGHGSYAADDWSFLLSGDVGLGGGYVELTDESRGPVDEKADSERRNFTFRAEHTPEPDRRFYFDASIFDEDRDNGTPLQTNSRIIGSYALGAELGDPETGRLQANLFGSVQGFDNTNSRTFDGRSRETLQKEQEVPVHDVGGSLQWGRAMGPFPVVSLGADIRFIDGENQEVVFDPEGAVEEAFTSGGKQILGGAFAQAVFAPTERWQLEGGLRVDTWSNFDAAKRFSSGGTDEGFPSRTDAEVSPRVGIRFSATEQVTLRGAAYRTFRAPNLNELYRGFFTSNLSFEPNPELGSETLVGGEAGFDWTPDPRLRISGTGFWNEIEDQIEFVFQGREDGIGILQRENLGETRIRGAEAEVSFRPLSFLTLSGNYSFFDSEIQEATSEEVVGNDVPDVPRHRATVRASYEHDLFGQLTAVLRFQGEEYEDDQNADPIDSFTVMDLNYRVPLRSGATLLISVENVWDEDVVTTSRNEITRLGLPRTVRVGLSVDAF